MKISTIILSMATLTGLVSCYPVVPYEGGPTKKATATTAKKAQAKKKAAVAAAKKKAAQAASGDTATGDLGLPSGTTEVDKTSPPVLPTVPDIVKPKVIKYAAMVPGKEGFVFKGMMYPLIYIAYYILISVI